MELLLGIVIALTIFASLNWFNGPKPRSRYDQLPKPPVSISRTYEGEVGEAVRKTQKQRQGTAREL